MALHAAVFRSGATDADALTIPDLALMAEDVRVGRNWQRAWAQTRPTRSSCPLVACLQVRRYVRTVVVTLGPHGVLAPSAEHTVEPLHMTPARMVLYPALGPNQEPLQVRSVTGAGDRCVWPDSSRSSSVQAAPNTPTLLPAVWWVQ